MKRSIRIIAGILAILMLSSCFIACDNTDVVDDTTTAAEQGEDSKVLPEMNWEGEEYVILGRGGGSHLRQRLR